VNIVDRLTKTLDNSKGYFVEDDKVEHEENGFTGQAINKLATFENVYADLQLKQVEISKELEKLRSEDKTKTVKFKQLLTNKLTNGNVIMLLESYGLK
jgi:hypothetical protein